MSTVNQIVNSVWAMNNNEALTPENVISLILVEKWTHQDWEELNYENLEDEEVTMIDMWVCLNHNSYRKTGDLMNDLTEVFLGVTMGCAGILVSDFIRSWGK